MAMPASIGLWSNSVHSSCAKLDLPVMIASLELRAIGYLALQRTTAHLAAKTDLLQYND
jgi:hypothetical protein